MWEEYLAILLNPYFTHSHNKTRENPIYIYKNRRDARFPDFYSNKVILDAKYKSVTKNKNGDLNREDLYQLISYLHVKKSESAGVVYPAKDEVGYKKLGDLEGFGGVVFKLGFEVPSEKMGYSYSEFEQQMMESEQQLIEELNRVQGFRKI